MAANQLSASALIDAAPQTLYAILADYQHGHAKILPNPPFVGLAVVQGGVGAGTVIEVQLRILGQIRSFRSTITEPDPGRVLVETSENGYVTSFIVEPQDDGRQARVTISTDMSSRTGLAGSLERWFVTRMLLPVYVRELENLARAAAAE